MTLRAQGTIPQTGKWVWDLPIVTVTQLTQHWWITKKNGKKVRKMVTFTCWLQSLQLLITMIKSCSSLFDAGPLYQTNAKATRRASKFQGIQSSSLNPYSYSYIFQTIHRNYIWKEKHNCAQCQTPLCFEKSEHSDLRRSETKIRQNWRKHFPTVRKRVLFHSPYI